MTNAFCLPSPAGRISRSALRTLVITLVVAGIAVSPLGADDSARRDLLCELKVRDALAQDAKLRPLNLVVRVKARVATLSGQVPSRELAKRAVETAGKVLELREVCDKLTVHADDNGLLFPLLATPAGKVLPPPTSSAMTPSELKPQKTAVTGVWIPVNPEPMDRPIVGVALLPAITPLPGTGGPVSRPKEKASAEPPDAAAIAAAVQSLLQGDERYRRLRFEVKQNKVYLSGQVHRWADLQELARATTHIPGVEAVVLKDVKTDPPRK